MLKYVLSTAVAALLTLAAHAQKAPAPKTKKDPAAGKVAVPVGPTLPGEERLTAQERAERTFLMPPRKKMSSVQAAPRPQLDPSSAEDLAIGLPAAEEVVEETATPVVKAAAPKRTYRTRTRSHSSARRSTSKSKTTSKRSSAKKKTTAKATPRKASSRRRR
ncbi:hypothetical protein [Hymenobacter koreensis]|uniref:Uncharacterized protein n=1 Tax=Hymenobacter koreensis TaxID=1084523 RepID=A0ABP8IVY2_9BACT